MLAFEPNQAGRHSISLNGPDEAPPARDVLPRAQPAHLLRVPPFPKAGPVAFAVPRRAATDALPDCEIDSALELIRSRKVGGNYWGSQPRLPEAPYTLVRVRDDVQRSTALGGCRTAVAWRDDCDPWHLLSGASAVIIDADDELALIAAIARVPVECVGNGRFAALAGGPSRSAIRRLFRTFVVEEFTHVDPYSGEPIGLVDAIECCGFWRRLIDSNRDVSGAVGFAFWKRDTVAPLLWAGSERVTFMSAADGVRTGDRIAVWKSRTPARVLADLQRRSAAIIEVEDGFIRSVGLGADCVPPLSIIVDRLGIYFDPARPSELELLIQSGDFSSELLDRARRLRELIVASGVSKYATGHAALERRDPSRRHILVPGQVEDDRAVVSGGGGLTNNLELLRRVRAEAPDAYIIYKPHPDVEAGHRTGAIPDELCLSVADEIVRKEPISALIDLADEVHVNSSLAGFEALLREKPVTTHGVPFYAGWGLTRDLGLVPERRTARRSLDELVAAALLLYPRYLDPVTGLPCPPEVLVQRLTESKADQRDGIVVRLRRFQGRCRRRLAALGQMAAIR
jgi:capsular polysaccharide export protein